METLARSVVVDRLRQYLLGLVDEDHTICDVAARRRIFCQGFRRCSSKELREKFNWIDRKDLSDEQFTDLVNAYLLGRKQSLDAPLACDAQLLDRDTCLGWDEFSDAALAGFHEEWLGTPVQIEPET